jgi:DNA mismatch endonuclease (patch repair protein)
MTDVLTKEQRQRNMRNIKGKDTKPELILRRALHAAGFRYQLHRSDLPGKPDLVFPKYRAVIFVHGCFWHRHGCRFTTTPATRKEFWERKFRENVERDLRNVEKLTRANWRVYVVWECALKNKIDELDIIDSVFRFLTN